MPIRLNPNRSDPESDLETQLLAMERVHVAHPVDAQLWRDFVWMTPLNQDLSDAEKQRIADSPAPTVTIDLNVAVCR